MNQIFIICDHSTFLKSLLTVDDSPYYKTIFPRKMPENVYFHAYSQLEIAWEQRKVALLSQGSLSFDKAGTGSFWFL